MFFKLMLVSRLENLVSDRRLVEHCALRLDTLYFLGYELDEDLPRHSTLSRTRQLYPASVFEHLFDQVFGQCVAAGLVAGDTQVVDSAPVKANASLDSLRKKASVVSLHVAQETTPPAESAKTALQLRRIAARQAKRQAEAGSLGVHHAKAQLLSNKTPYIPTDSEARISVKPGKARALNYFCSLAVDTATGVISHIQADLTDSRDCLHLPVLVPRLQARLRAQELTLHDFVADTSYSNGFNHASLEQRGITPWIPIFDPYKPTVEGFTYEPAADAYRCRADKLLPFHSNRTIKNKTWAKQYRAAYKDCQWCSLKVSCVPHSQFKQVIRSVFDAAYRRAWPRQRTRRGQQMRRVRQRTVEPVFGSLLHHYGLRRVGTKGQAAAHKSMLLSAMAYNLKKLLKHQSTQAARVALALSPPTRGLRQAHFSTRLSSLHFCEFIF